MNVAEAAGLRTATRVDLSRLNFTTSVYEPIAVIDDPGIVEQFVSLLDSPIPLTESTDCTPIFRLAYRLSGGTAEFDYICSEDSNVIRGGQTFWQSLDGVAPRELSRLLGPYAARVPIPGFPARPVRSITPFCRQAPGNR